MEVNIRTNPHTLFLTVTNRAANLLNLMAIDVLFSTQLPLANVLDGKRNSMNVYSWLIHFESFYILSIQMQIQRTTCCWWKHRQSEIHDSIIFVQSQKYILLIFSVYNSHVCYYHIVPGYAATVHKIMGQNIPHVTLVFDLRKLLSTVGYVALSRVNSIHNIVPLRRLRKS